MPPDGVVVMPPFAQQPSTRPACYSPCPPSPLPPPLPPPAASSPLTHHPCDHPTSSPHPIATTPPHPAPPKPTRAAPTPTPTPAAPTRAVPLTPTPAPTTTPHPTPPSAHALDLPLVLWQDIFALLPAPADQRALCSTARPLRPLLAAPAAAITHLPLASSRDIPLAPLHRLFPAATSLALLSSFFASPEWLHAFLTTQLPLLPAALALSADLQAPCALAPHAFAALAAAATRLRSLNLYNLHPPAHHFLAPLPALAPTLRRLTVSAHPTLNPQGDAHPTPPALAPLLPSLCLLTHLTLANLPLTPDLAASIARLPALRSLALRATPSSDAALSALLPAAPTLTTLSVSSILSHPRGDATAPAAWATLLTAATSLQHLTITLPALPPPAPAFLPPSLLSLSLTTPANPAPHLAPLTALSSLSWHGHHTTDPDHEVATAGAIANLTALRKLDLGLLALPAEEISRVHYLSELTGLTSIQLSHHTHQYCWSPAHLPQWCPPSVTEFNKAATPRARDGGPCSTPGTPLTPSQLVSPAPSAS